MDHEVEKMEDDLDDKDFYEPKEEVNVKVEVPDLYVDENKKTLYAEVVQFLQAARMASSKAYSAAQESSFMLFPEEKYHKLFENFSSPLLNAVESLDLSLSVLQTVELEFYGCHSGLFQDSGYPSYDNDHDNDNDNDLDNDTLMSDDDPEPEYKPVPTKSRKKKEKEKDSPGDYTCDQCSYSTNTARYLQYHKQSHLPGKYQCELCSFNKSKPYEMKVHMKKTHDYSVVEYLVDRENPDVKYFLCKYCSYSNVDQNVLQKHTDEKHPDGLNVKREDDEDYHEESNGDLPVKDEVKKEKDADEPVSTAQYSCPKCSYTTSSIKCYEDHVQGIFAYKKCPFCPKEFKAQRGKTFRTHLKKMHKCYSAKGNLRCTICETEYPTISKFEFHMTKVHNMGMKYHCPHCDYTTEKKSLYNLHRVEHGNADFPCPHCSFMAKSNLRLEKHIYAVHQQSSVEICDECGYEGTSKMNLRYHKQQKHKEKNVSCEQCGFMTTTQGLLNLHIKVKHLKYYEKRAVELFCDQCEYVTKNKQSLKVHVNSKHLKVRYPCNMCDTTFASFASLGKHRRAKHSNEKKLMCEEKNCGYSTFCKDNLKCHVEKVHQGIRWPCDQCQYVGGYKGDLTRHMKVVHHGFMLKCQMCDFSTPKKYALSGHMLKVHGMGSNENAMEDTKIF